MEQKRTIPYDIGGFFALHENKSFSFFFFLQKKQTYVCLWPHLVMQGAMPSLLERSDRESSMETHSGGGKKSSSHDVAGGEPVKHGQVRLSESSAGDEEESGGRKYHPKSSPTSQLLQVCSTTTLTFLLLFIFLALPRAFFFIYRYLSTPALSRNFEGHSRKQRP